MPSSADASRSARDRLLDAAVDVATTNGLTKLSVGDVAKRAGLSRQTLYKHFASKEDLVAQAVLRETGAMVEQVVAAADAHEDPEDSLEAAIATMLRVARAHPLLDRLITTEPEALLPLLVGDRGPVPGAVRAVGESVLAQRLPDLDPADVHRAADVLGRLLVSYAVAAPDESPEVVAAFLARTLTAGLTSSADASTSPR
ncbi:MAG: TetR/AcrR family transcriptional regulator [Acidimicrobiales bacterium]|nr:TetR/AcrR family transcriptional regulator [Acidimicrobiales bacterium]MCB1260541.1 TetR/AcrR family transcriptional regulator [Acidimicrobiales bacterium]